MQAGTLVGSDVRAYASRVLVNGVQRPVLSWSVDRDLVGDLPDQVVAGGGVAQATGSIQWDSGENVSDGSLNPWNSSTGWIPKAGDRVQIFAGDTESEWSQFVGVIDEPAGGVGDGMSSTIIDRLDDLSRKVSIPALLLSMPPVEVGGTWRRVGVSTLHHMNTALRRGGFYTTPPAEFGCVVDVPMQGSCWPLVGGVATCHRTSDPNTAPGVASAPWGTSRYDLTAVYTPAVSRAGSVPVQFTIMCTPEHAGNAWVTLAYGTKSIAVLITASTIWLTVNGAAAGNIPLSGASIIQVLHKDGVLTAKTNAGRTVSTGVSLGATVALEKVTVTAAVAARIAGLQVSHPTQPHHEFGSVGFASSATINVGAMHTGNFALPAIDNESARDVIEKIGKATLRPFWIDETGAAKIIASDALRGSASVQTITTLDDIQSLSWRSSLLGVRSEVSATYLRPMITVRQTPSIEVWSQSQSIVLQSLEEHEEVVEAPTDEDWVLVDEQPKILGINNLEEINRGVASVFGGIYTDGANEAWASFPGTDKLTATMTRLGPRTWSLKHSAKTMPATHQVELRMKSAEQVGSDGLWPFWWGHLLGIIRAKGLVKWVQSTRNPSIAGLFGPPLELDFGPWATGGIGSETESIDAITSFVAEQVTTPQATIDSVRVGFDPRRQLGDVITIDSPGFMGVRLKCLIVGISNSAGRAYEQSLKVRIISTEKTFTTYAEFEQAWGPVDNYGAFETAWETLSSYDDFNADPLRGTN